MFDWNQYIFHIFTLIIMLCCRKIKDEVDGAAPAKKIKSEKVGSDEENEMKKQNKIMFDYRDQLKNQLKKKELQELLEYNGQEVPVGPEKVQSFLSVVVLNGWSC